MPFKGAGTYEIVPYQKPSLNMNLWEGGMKPGAPIKTYPRGDSPSTNALWVVALVKDKGADSEYIITNARNGYYLVANDTKSVILCDQIAPTDSAARWTIKDATRNGYDVWTINSVSGRGQCNVRGGSLNPGAEIIMWTYDNTDNATWYFDPAK